MAGDELEQRLGEALFRELERLDPISDEPYEMLAAGERDIYRHAIMAVLERNRDLVLAALRT
jgi:hypothetical protein